MRKVLMGLGVSCLVVLGIFALTSSPSLVRTAEASPASFNLKNNCACTRSQGCECHWAQIGDPACGCLAGHPEFCHNACTCISLLGAQVPDYGPSPSAGRDTEIDGFMNGISTVGGYAMDNAHEVNLDKSWNLELRPAPDSAPSALTKPIVLVPDDGARHVLPVQ